MLLFELVGTESHPTYETLAIQNLDRQYTFVESIFDACMGINRRMITADVIRALNYHAIACLHVSAGQWRPCNVSTKKFDGSTHHYPDFYRVPALMEAFIDEVNRSWNDVDPVVLAAFVLWRLNNIHPFINGNGRTARVACLLVLCLKLGVYLGGEHLLPELIRAERDEYVVALRQVDASWEQGSLNLTPLHALLVRLLEKIQSDSGDAANSDLSAANTPPTDG